MYLLESGAGNSTLEDAEILLCVDIEGFFIYIGVFEDSVIVVWGVDVWGGDNRLVVYVVEWGVAMGCMGRGGWAWGRVSVQGRVVNLILGRVLVCLGLGRVLEVVLEVEMMISGGGEQLIDRIAH